MHMRKNMPYQELFQVALLPARHLLMQLPELQHVQQLLCLFEAVLDIPDWALQTGRPLLG